MWRRTQLLLKPLCSDGGKPILRRPLNSLYLTSSLLPRHAVRSLSTPAAPKATSETTSCADSALIAGLVGALLGAGIAHQYGQTEQGQWFNELGSGKGQEKKLLELPQAATESTEIARPVSYVLEGQEDTLCSVAPVVGKAVRPEEVDMVLFHGYAHREAKERVVSSLEIYALHLGGLNS